jgi:uncharacterized membrane protein
VIKDSIDIARSPQDVFTYLDQLDRHRQWQPEIVSTTVESDGPVGVGTRVKELRKFGNRQIDSSYEITEHDPPRRTAFRGLVGPIRPEGTVTLEPLDEGRGTRVTLEFDLIGYGVGKLFAPLARRHARRTIPGDQQRLKEQLEKGA